MLPMRIAAHNPRYLLPMLGLSYLAAAKGQLNPEVQSLATHLVAQRNGCSWCIDFGRHMAAQHGESSEKLAAVCDYATNPIFSPAERAALAYTDAMTAAGAHVSDEVFAEVRSHFSERAIVELTAAAAAEGFFNRFNGALGIEAQGFCALPVRPEVKRRRVAAGGRATI
jgi:AhpD family alkylhydroperoxidase